VPRFVLDLADVLRNTVPTTPALATEETFARPLEQVVAAVTVSSGNQWQSVVALVVAAVLVTPV